MILERFRIAFMANGNHEIHIYVFLKNCQYFLDENSAKIILAFDASSKLLVMSNFTEKWKTASGK